MILRSSPARTLLLLFLLLTASSGAARAQERTFDITDTTAVFSAPRTGAESPAQDGTAIFNDIRTEASSATAQDSLRLLAPRTSLPDSLRVDEESFKLFLDKIEVEGKLEKPQAIFIIPGSDPEIDDIQIQRSFFEEIFRPVEPAGRIGLKQKPSSTSKRKDVFPW
ncbi:MAG TPA: hypothetical protein PKI81_02375 [bacterium]|jgi:hypothetical protein|nr:hypothetical protein [bacterium]HOC90311.1 hypothetical protein [bacterium]HOZ21776.1 hypothetical protein [bacterium]